VKKDIKCEKKFKIEQHSKTAAHVRSKEKNSTPQKQLFLSQLKPKTEKNTFSIDLCEALVWSCSASSLGATQLVARVSETFCLNQF